MLAKHLEGSALVDRMALHEYSLRALRDGAAPGADDRCRRSRGETERGFALTEAYVLERTGAP